MENARKCAKVQWGATPREGATREAEKAATTTNNRQHVRQHSAEEHEAEGLFSSTEGERGRYSEGVPVLSVFLEWRNSRVTGSGKEKGQKLSCVCLCAVIISGFMSSGVLFGVLGGGLDGGGACVTPLQAATCAGASPG